MGAVAIVGGGVAGLSAAYRLKQRGIRVVVYEAGDRVGGVVRTERRDGFVADLGPNSIAGPSPHLRAMLTELGLDGSLLPASPAARTRYIVKKKKLRPLPMSPQDFLTTRLLTNGAKLAFFGEALVDPGDGTVEESVAAFVRRRFNQEILDYVANPFVAGIYAGNPEQLSVRHALPRLYGLERAHGSVVKAFAGMMRGARRDEDAAGDAGGMISFRTGIQELPEALARELHAEIRTRATVTQVRAGPKGWTVGAAFQPTELYDGVIYAAPAHCVDDVDLAFPGGDRLKTLASITHPPVGVLVLGFRREDVAHPLDGFGFLVPRGQSPRALGVLWDSSIFRNRAPEGRELLRVMIGGALDPAAVELSDRELIEVARGDLATTLRLMAQPELVRIARHAAGIPQYTVGHLERLARIDERLFRHPALFVTGNGYRGVAINACVTEAVGLAERLLAPGALAASRVPLSVAL